MPIILKPPALRDFPFRMYFSHMPAKSSSKSPVSLPTAIETFLGGIAMARSHRHPYEVHRIAPLWVMRDAPRKRAADYRREEWVVHDLDAAKADALIRRQTRGRFCICAIRSPDQPEEPLRAAYKAAGYRLGSTEAIMAHGLRQVPEFPEPFPIQRVATLEMADRLNKAAGRTHAGVADLDGKKVRSFVALDDGRPIGWVTSFTIAEQSWVQSMYVAPPYRRRGIGKTLLAQLLKYDRAHGAKASYLTASHAGAMLYPHVGFQVIGQLLLYTPRARPKTKTQQS
jgi:GNAT superfamily N-acetyltransferase